MEIFDEIAFENAVRNLFPFVIFTDAFINNKTQAFETQAAAKSEFHFRNWLGETTKGHHTVYKQSQVRIMGYTPSGYHIGRILFSVVNILLSVCT